MVSWKKKVRRVIKSSCCCCLTKASGSETELVILMLGLDNAGKTCTAKTMVGEPLLNITPTIGFSKVQTHYKGYDIIIYDLGGSRSFRGIWPKYYHEVHGFIFVVDSSDETRLKECSQELKSFLHHDKVQGKPLLILCNKFDDKNAVDELHIVEALNIEQLVNQAACPTRMEPTVATKGTGLRNGYKWLIKSIILDMGRLGPRVERDRDEERERDAVRLEEIRRRIKERKEKEDATDIEDISTPGFIPIKELAKKITNGNANGKAHHKETPPTSSKSRRIKQMFNNKTVPIPSNENTSKL